MLEDSKDIDNEKEDKDNNNIDNRPSYKPCTRKPCRDNLNNKGTTLSSRLSAK